jgi:sRNA-binding regulator protein Hfq
MRSWLNFEAPEAIWYNLTTGDNVEASNRKLIRPSLTDVKEPKEQAPVVRKTQPKKPIPPDQTNAENFYYIKQMQSKTPMTIVLKDGEILHGVIEWYDKASLKVNRDEGPNLLVYKSNIKYMYKAL